MRYAGIDIGSRAVKLVVLDAAGAIALTRQTDTGFAPLAAAQRLLADVAWERITATGYGRDLFAAACAAPTVTEIKAHARGACALFPGAAAVLDIGGQDSKAIALAADGRVRKFEMNDRCAAGTGKFLEFMARTLGFDLAEFGAAALTGGRTLQITSTCAVFAESEVTSLLAQGADRRDIAHALHRSVVRRVASMINRVAPDGDLVFAGGVARNPCLCALLTQELRRKVLVPSTPHFVGALGAALLSAEAAGADTHNAAGLAPSFGGPVPPDPRPAPTPDTAPTP